MTITPGYNFDTNEIPTKERLALMTAGMSITGIALSQISTALIGVLIGDTNSTSLAEGWIRRSPAGGLYVWSRWGEVHLWRGAWGGMESRRYPFAGGGAFAQRVTGHNLAPLSTSTTLESCVVWTRGTPLAADTWRSYKCLDTTPSLAPTVLVGYTGHGRMLLFGGGIRDVESQGGARTNPSIQQNAATPSNDLMGQRSAPISGQYSAAAGASLVSGSMSWNYQASNIYWPAISWMWGFGTRII
jgi:hypothetical protein